MLRIDKIKFFLFLLIFFHVSVNFFVLKADSSPLLGEQFNNFLKSCSVYKLLGGGDVAYADGSTQLFGLVDAVYPPLMYFAASFFFAVFGMNVFAALFSLSFFFALLIFYSYRVYGLFMKKQDALFASAVLSFIPGVYGFSRILHVDFILLSMLSVAYYYLLLAVEKRDVRGWIIGGFCFGLSFLSKQSAVVFLLPLGIYALWLLKKKEVKLTHLLLCALVCFVTASIWYVLNLSSENSLPIWALCKKLDLGQVYSFSGNYLRELRIHLLGNIAFLTGVLSVLGVLLFARNHIKILFAACLVFPFVFFSVISNIYSVRYLIPLSLFLCFFIPYFLDLLFSSRKLKFLIRSVLLGSMLVIFCSNLTTRVYSSDDLILKDDKQGLLSPLSYKHDISQLTDIISSADVTDPKIATVYNTLAADYLRFAFFAKTGGRIVLKKEGLVDVFYSRDFRSFTDRYDVLLLKDEQTHILLKQDDFPPAFVSQMQAEIKKIIDGGQGFSFAGKAVVLLGGKEHNILVFVRNQV